MTELFNRDMNLIVGSTLIQMRQPGDKEKFKPTLKATFGVTKDGNRDPNKATISVTNLSADHRKIIAEKQPIVLNAGYVGDLQLIFEGDITKANTAKAPTDWITTVEAKDGDRGYAVARINKSFAKNTKKSDIVLAAADALGLGLGNAREKLLAKDRIMKRGTTITGRAPDVLDKYVPDFGYRWSIQDNQLMLLEKGETTLETVYVLNKESGLVGSPEIGEKGRVTFTSLLRGQIKPGRRVEIESKVMEGGSGIYKVDKATYDGDTKGSNWYTHGEGMPTQ